MAESTLSLTLSDLRSEVGFYLGYGRTYGSMSAAQAANVDAVVKSGQRRFYFAHEWSFLKPTATLALTSSDYDYDLPDSFGDIEGDMTFATTDYKRGPVKRVGEGQIRALREASTSSGPPQYFALRVKDTTLATESSRYEVIFWPTPDTTYTMSYRGAVNIDALATTTHYPLGGAQHAETARAAVMAAAEESLNDGQQNWQQKFAALLAQSMRIDARKDREYFGYMADRSDMQIMNRKENFDSVAQYNGVSYP